MTSVLSSLQTAEILVPHEVAFRPLVAVRNTLIQASLGELREAGYYERYAQHIPETVLSELSSNLGPGWMPIELADAHYAACDVMRLTEDELRRIGEAVGLRVRQTFIVVAGKKDKDGRVDVFGMLAQMYRVWKRLYQGGSVQITKLSPAEELIEFRGFSLNRHHYYRLANLAAVVGVHEAIGVRIDMAKLLRYDPTTHDVVIQMGWS
jgi:hypothetical protein